jgi:SNF2 family DNA or RNA helicase
LLASAISEYKEDLLGTNLSLSQIIKKYDDLETPAKLDELLRLAKSLHEQGEKVVIWSNFIESLKLIKKALTEQQIKAQLIYGATPTQNSSVSDELTREGIIKEFLKENGEIDALVANPAACAESISLHKACAHAIYYDLSYNCAQYLQSLDRIHRVGGSENKQAHYYFLQYANTIDADILYNVQQKAENMSCIIDQDYAIYSLDMFDEDDELRAYTLKSLKVI